MLCHMTYCQLTQFNNMPVADKCKKSLKAACWQNGMTISELCRRAGITRQTAYDAWEEPERFPIAAPKIFNLLKLEK